MRDWWISPAYIQLTCTHVYQAFKAKQQHRECISDANSLGIFCKFGLGLGVTAWEEWRLDLSHKYNLSITPWRCVDHGLAASATQAAWHNRNKKQLAGEFNNKDWCDWEGQYVTVVSVLFIKLEKQKKHHSPYVFRSFWLDCTIGLHPYMWGTNWLFCFHLNSNKLCFFFLQACAEEMQIEHISIKRSVLWNKT